MPSPSALAKYAMAFMAAPLNQGTINAPVNREAINTHVNHGGMSAAAYSGLYLCVDGGFNGYCRWFTEPFRQCTNLDGDLAYQVSAAGPDKGNWCTLYAGWDCTGQEYQLHWPGESHLGDRGYNDMAVSFNCAAE